MLILLSIALTLDRTVALKQLLTDAGDMHAVVRGPELAFFLLHWLLVQLFIIVLAFPRATLGRIRAGFATAVEPRTLALQRLIICAIWLTLLDVDQLTVLAAAPRELLHRAPGAAELLELLGATPARTQLVGRLLAAAAILGAVGLFSRAALLALALAGAYCSLLLRAYGAPYTLDLLVAATLLLFAAPCADVLSADAYLRRAPASDTRRYGLWFQLLRMVVAAAAALTVLGRCLSSGVDWLHADAALAMLQTSWYLRDLDPPAAAAAFALRSAPVLVLVRAVLAPLLPLAVLSRGYGSAVIGVWLAADLLLALCGEPVSPPLAFLSLLLVDWGSLLGCRRRRPAHRSVSWVPAGLRAALAPLAAGGARLLSLSDRPRLSAMLGTVLLAAYLSLASDIGRGRLLETQPVIAFDRSQSVDRIGLAAYQSGGRVDEVAKSELAAILSKGMLFELEQNVLAEEDPDALILRLAAFWHLVAGHGAGVQRATTAQFFLDNHTVVPKQRNFNPLHRTLLLDLRVAGDTG